MKDLGRLFWLVVGMLLGGVAVGLYVGQSKPAEAANDRYEDYVMCTGTVSMSAGSPTEGLWLLDYRAGKLLGTVIDRGTGKIGGWAEVDLVAEFGIAPRQNVHFLMTAGQISKTQAAVYVAETTSGKMAVYTMAPRLAPAGPAGQNVLQPGISISRHDLVMFRQAAGKDKEN